jgi:hypothetical protein
VSKTADKGLKKAKELGTSIKKKIDKILEDDIQDYEVDFKPERDDP